MLRTGKLPQLIHKDSIQVKFPLTFKQCFWLFKTCKQAKFNHLSIHLNGTVCISSFFFLHLKATQMAFFTGKLECGCFYLQEEVRGVVHQHHQSANPHKVGTVGETDEEYGGDVMNHLLLEILEHTHEHTETTQYEEDARQRNRELSSSPSVALFISCVQALGCQIYTMSGVICCCV